MVIIYSILINSTTFLPLAGNYSLKLHQNKESYLGNVPSAIIFKLLLLSICEAFFSREIMKKKSKNVAASPAKE